MVNNKIFFFALFIVLVFSLLGIFLFANNSFSIIDTDRIEDVAFQQCWKTLINMDESNIVYNCDKQGNPIVEYNENQVNIKDLKNYENKLREYSSYFMICPSNTNSFLKKYETGYCFELIEEEYDALRGGIVE